MLAKASLVALPKRNKENDKPPIIVIDSPSFISIQSVFTFSDYLIQSNLLTLTLLCLETFYRKTLVSLCTSFECFNGIIYRILYLSTLPSADQMASGCLMKMISSMLCLGVAADSASLSGDLSGLVSGHLDASLDLFIADRTCKAELALIIISRKCSFQLTVLSTL